MENITNFAFFDLAALTPGKSFPGFAAGDFVDMRGREIVLEASDLQEFVSNTLALITQYQNKNMPGLPIDARLHDKGDAAGWITGAELGEVIDSRGNVIPAINIVADWTDLGVELIEKKRQTNFSPTVNLTGKVILGGSLTNWPATIDVDGVPLLSAVELAQGVGTHEIRENKPMSDELERAEGVDTPEPEQVAGQVIDNIDLSGMVDAADLAQIREAMQAQVQNAIVREMALIREQAQSQVAELVAAEQRRGHIVDLAQRWTGGTEANPRGFAVGYEEIETFLNGLNAAQLQAAESIFGRIWDNGLVEYTELGHGRKVNVKRPVPDYAVDSLQAALAAGNSPQEFFELAGLGNAEDYDLTAYIGESNNG